MNKDPDLSDEQDNKKRPDPKSINLEKPENAEKPHIKHNATKKMSFAEKCTWDYIFSYETNKELNVLDRRLGYTYIICFFIVFTYILIYIFILEKLYLDKEKCYGDTIARIIGKSHSKIKDKIHVWDESSTVLSHAEPNSVFIPTLIKITKNQKKGDCPSISLPCLNNTDCKPNELPIYMEKDLCQNLSTTQKGCVINQWCPEEDNEGNHSEIHKLIGASHQRILINAQMTFPKLAPEKTFTTFKKNKLIEYPLAGANTFTVKDLLQSSGEYFENVEALGCVLQVSIIWECSLIGDDDCQPNFRVNRLDDQSSKGFSFRKTFYADNMKSRDQFTYIGIRIYFSNVGKGHKASLFNVIIQLYTAIALIGGAKLITDFLMLNFYREKKHYSSMKQIETKDMNE